MQERILLQIKIGPSLTDEMQWQPANAGKAKSPRGIKRRTILSGTNK
jgi:hypothetical protein